MNNETHIELTDVQKEVSRINALTNTAEAFEAIAKGDEKLAGIYAKAAFRYARRIVEGVKK